MASKRGKKRREVQRRNLELYRHTHLGVSLKSTLETLIGTDVLTRSVAEYIYSMFDEVIAKNLKHAPQIKLQGGNVAYYKINDNNLDVMLQNASFSHPSGTIETPLLHIVGIKQRL